MRPSNGKDHHQGDDQGLQEVLIPHPANPVRYMFLVICVVLYTVSK